MRLATRSGLITTSLVVAAIAAPTASAGTGAQPSGLSPWAGPLALAHGTSGSVKAPPPIVRVTAPSDGFDYGDAAVGAGIVGGIALLTGAGGGLTVRRRSQLRHS